jgi:hypothetical protein
VAGCAWRRILFGYHPTIGWWYLPKMRARLEHAGYGYYVVRTNASGMRSDRDYPRRTPTGRRRIVVLGDSYTAGDGVDNPSRYTDLLERWYPELDVLNFALPGSGTDQQLLVYEQLAREYDADGYVFAVLIENIFRNGQRARPSWSPSEGGLRYRAKPYFSLQGEELELHHQPVPPAARPEDALGDWASTSFGFAESARDPYALYRDPEHPLCRLLGAILARFLRQVDGRPVAVVPLPVREHLYGDRSPDYLPFFRSLAGTSAGPAVPDLLEGFLALPRRDRQRCVFGATDGHYTAAGHRVVAAELAAVVEAWFPELAESRIEG